MTQISIKKPFVNDFFLDIIISNKVSSTKVQGGIDIEYASFSMLKDIMWLLVVVVGVAVVMVLVVEVVVFMMLINLIKTTSIKIERHTNIQPGKLICFPYTKKQSPDQTKSRAHQIMFR